MISRRASPWHPTSSASEKAVRGQKAAVSFQSNENRTETLAPY